MFLFIDLIDLKLMLNGDGVLLDQRWPDFGLV
jgi:hypothetical protein